MGLIKKLNLKVKIVNNGMFHDSRADVRAIGQTIKKIAEKVDELIDEINNLKKDSAI
ncbi:hypothetical protein SDC9_107083 [bioreactor metagenome]|uniref:Uncharacterized protein n=1 Tax=bioreactor metagenome TaxID=1076179 RepID=A0A645B472_9ZZZZ